jgi:hypothetical protein
MLWLEVVIYHKWLGNELNNSAFVVSFRALLWWFSNTGKDIVTKVGSTESGGPNDDFICMSICANSMYKIIGEIMLSYQANIDQVSQVDLFVQSSY